MRRYKDCVRTLCLILVPHNPSFDSKLRVMSYLMAEPREEDNRILTAKSGLIRLTAIRKK